MNRVGHSLLISAEPFTPAWDEDRARDICSRLELGDIVLFSHPPVDLPARDRDVLLGRKQRGSAYHKNIAYRPSEDRVTGLDAAERAEAAEWRRILRGYSQDAVAFLSRFLLPYAGQWKLDYTSFRAVEEQGRLARLHARNDLLHVDSFPTRPTNGARILRFFTNINAARNRVWLTSQTFESFGPQFARMAGVSGVFRNPVSRGLRAFARALRLPGSRPPYDELMHRLQNAMKEDALSGEQSQTSLGISSECILEALHRRRQPRRALGAIRTGTDPAHSPFRVDRAATLTARHSRICRRCASHGLTLRKADAC